MGKVSEYKRYRDGLWIPSFKRTYLYWFKFLVACEESEHHAVDWKKYDGWGGSNYILGVKFDKFWEDNWKTLFGVKNQGDVPKHPLNSTRVKTENLRICWLIYLYRDTPIGKREIVKDKRLMLGDGSGGLFERNVVRRTNTLDIAERIYKTEKRSATFNTIYTWDLSDDRNPNEEKDVATLVNRYQRRTKTIMKNVCVGKFP